jgi:SAM-dependent methyltransferase
MTRPGPLQRAAARVVSELEVASRPTDVSRVGPALGVADGGCALNRICRMDVWDDPVWLQWNRAVGFDATRRRKEFEWVQCIYGLETLGALGDDKRVLGVGVGHEPVLFYLANRSALTVATDVYEGKFAAEGAAEASPDFLDHPKTYAPFPYRADRLQVLRADGRVLPFEDSTFDVVYSLGSVEHFGGHNGSAAAMREMARVLKPTGTLCVATEWILEGGDHFEYFTPDQFQQYIVEPTGLALVEPIDATPPPQGEIDNCWMMGIDDSNSTPMIVIGEGDLRWTSVVVFLQRRPTVVDPATGGTDCR